MSADLVLNASYEPLHRVSMEHAIRMLVRMVAVVEEVREGQTFGPWPRPKGLRLVRYLVMRWRYRHTPTCTKEAVKARDRMCAYCLDPAETIDHLIPRSRGGLVTWTNTVAACRGCNHRKGNRTPAEAGMRLLITPVAPS
ncbi:HNH endonuclease [Aeromicrobium sp. CTD01-1L150]|uniref:HNH endonuclease n=1 Tax=Aeromicrobium sp. CTD01-1L150 TaxID=3341830 RepID=UPI0035BFBFAF